MRRMLNERASATLRKIELSHPQTAYLVRDARAKVVVHDRVPSSSIHSGATLTLHCGLDWFLDSESSQPAMLACENFDDAKVFHQFAKCLANLPGLKFDIRFELDAAGGSNLAQHVREKAKRHRRLIIAIADSDMEHSSAAIGSTARALCKLRQETSQGRLAMLLVHVLTSCREAENLLPISLLDQLASHGFGEASQTLDVLAKIGRGPWWRYFDTKRGMSEGDVAALAAQSPEWRTVNNFLVSHNDKAKVRLKSLPPIGPVLSRAASALESMSIQKMRELFQDDELAHVKTLFLDIAYLGCAARRSVT